MATIPQIERDPRVYKKEDTQLQATQAPEAPTNEVTLKSGENFQLSDTEMKLREKNLAQQATFQQQPTPQIPEMPKVEPIKSTQKRQQPVQTAQEIKNQALVNEADTRNLESQKRQQISADFANLVQSGATREQLATFANKNPEYKNDYFATLKNHFQNTENTKYFMKYGSMSNEQLYSAMKNGEVTLYDSKYNQLPQETKARFERYVKAQEALSIQDEFKPKDYGTSIESLVAFTETFYNNGITTKIENLKNDNRLVDLGGKLTRKSDEITKLDRTIAKTEKRIKEELAGANPARIRAAINDELEALYDEKQILLDEYKIIQGDYSSVQADIQADIEMLKYENTIAQQEYNAKLSLYTAKYSEMREDERASFEQQNTLLAEQRAQDYKKELMQIEQDYAEKNQKPNYMTDADGNLIAVVDGVATKVKDSNGEVVAVSKTENYTDSIQFDKENGLFYTTRTYTDGTGKTPDVFVNNINGNSNVSMGAFDIISKVPSKGKGPNGGLWCGEGTDIYIAQGGFVSATTGKPVDVSDSWESKKNYVNSNIPQIGGLAVWNPAQTENGHIGIVTGYNEQSGMVTITDWNYKNDGQKLTHDVPLSQIVNSDGGFVQLASEKIQNTEDDSDTSIAKGIINGVGSLSDLTPTDKKKILPIVNRLIEEQTTDDADRNLIVKSSTKTKDISDTALQKISDMNTVKYQLDTIENTLQGQDTGPILGKISSMNPYDTEAQVALAQLAGLTPKVARGIFGEVGVLTDTDIANYQKALPNLTSTKEKNDFIVSFMRDLLAEGYKNAIITQAKGGRNMSEFLSDYDSIVSTQEKTKIQSPQPQGGQSTMSGIYDWRSGGGIMSKYNSRPKLSID